MNESWFLMAVAGVANIVRFVSLLALSTEITAKERVGTAAGIVLSVGYTGAIIGPPISGYIFDLTNNLDLSFLSLIPMSIAATIIAFRLSRIRS